MESVRSRRIRTARAYAQVLAPRALARRARIGIDIFRDHQFERSSPLSAAPDDLSAAIGSSEVTLPPARYLGGKGSQTLEGTVFIASLARALQARTVLEIGTFKGVTAWTLARNIPEGGVVHTLDLPYDSRASLELSELDEANRRQPPERLFEKLPPTNHVEQHWGDSATFDFSPFVGRCDFVYVDGAHTRAYVQRDTATALKLIADEGAVVWDDYWRQEPGVRDVLENLTLSNLYRVHGTRLVFHLAPGAAKKLVSEP